jgi:hypothetical protein
MTAAIRVQRLMKAADQGDFVSPEVLIHRDVIDDAVWFPAPL